MTVKDALRERIDRMSEEEAAELLAQMEWESTEFEKLTAEELADAEAGRLENKRGDSVTGDELIRKLGL